MIRFSASHPVGLRDYKSHGLSGRDSQTNSQAKSRPTHSIIFFIETINPEQRGVIEHIAHLKECFEKLSLLLAEKGTLVMVTPNIESLQKKIFGKRWFQFKPWEHISYFSPEIMHRLADMYHLKIVHLSSCGQYADMSFVHHRLLRYKFERIAGIFKKFISLPGLKNKAWYLGTGSMLVVMQKK